VIGVEPAAGDDVTQSFRQKKKVHIAVPDTVAERCPHPVAGRRDLAAGGFRTSTKCSP